VLGSAMRKVLTKIHLRSDIFISKINHEGPKILSLTETI